MWGRKSDQTLTPKDMVAYYDTQQAWTQASSRGAGPR
jgi:hypothetical protein